MSIRLDGSDYLARTTNLPARDNVTFGAWVYIHASDATNRNIFSIGSNTTTYNGIRMTSGVLRLYSASFGANFSSSPSVPGWYYIFCQSNAAQQKGGWMPLGGSSFTTTTTSPQTSGTPNNMRIGTGRGVTTSLDMSVFRASVWGDGSVSEANLLLAANTDLGYTTSINTHLPLTSGIALPYADTSGNGYNWTDSGTILQDQDDPSLSQPQILLPSADITTNGWASSAGGALYAVIDESVASDSDYIYTGTLDAECEVQLQSGSTPGSGSKNLSVRVPAGFTPVGGWQVSLYQGASLVQSFTSPAPAANTTATFAVTNAITDYSDLRVRIKSTA